MAQTDVKAALRVFAQYLLEVGALLRQTGQLEIGQTFLRNSEAWSKLAERAKSELTEQDLASLSQILPRLRSALPKLKDMRNMPSSEKLRLGEELDRLGRDLLRSAM